MTNSPPINSDERLLILEEAAIFAHVSVGTIRRWIDAGLTSYGTGRILIRLSDLMAHLQRSQKRSRKAPAIREAEVDEPATGPSTATTTTSTMPNRENSNVNL